MKFSLKLLLVITFLAALTINWLNNRARINEFRSKADLVAKELDEVQLKTTCFDQRKKLYLQASKSFEERKQHLRDAPPFFEPVARIFRSSESEPPNKIHVHSVYNRLGSNAMRQMKEQFRVWIPESPTFELALGFDKERSPRSFPSKMRNSYYFKPQQQFTLPLESGHSIVEFEVSGIGNTSKVTIKVNGIKVHETSRDAVLSMNDILDLEMDRDSDRLISSIASSKRRTFDSSGVVLVTANLWPTKEESEGLAVVIRPIVEEEVQ